MASRKTIGTALLTGAMLGGGLSPVGAEEQTIHVKSNWVQTVPGKSFNLLYRMYGPLEAWFDKIWKLGDFELAK